MSFILLRGHWVRRCLEVLLEHKLNFSRLMLSLIKSIALDNLPARTELFPFKALIDKINSTSGHTKFPSLMVSFDENID